MNVLELFAPITTFVFDVDGVLTNGSLQLTEDGQLLRSMNIKDAYALQLAVKMGYQVWIITNGDSQAVRDKFLKAGLQQVHIAVKRKKDVLLQLVEETGIPLSQMLFMGDDLPDHACMRSVALPCCPNDAAQEIKQISRYISPFNGGCGCARDVVEKVLKLNGKWIIPDY